MNNFNFEYMPLITEIFPTHIDRKCIAYGNIVRKPELYSYVFDVDWGWEDHLITINKKTYCKYIYRHKNDTKLPLVKFICKLEKI
jgi:hypothetical protein